MLSARGKQTKNFVISFELKLDKEISGWTNVLRVFNEEQNCCKVGSRVPAVFVHGGTTKLHICHAINGNGNTCFNSKPLPKGQYTTVVIQQVLKYDEKYRYSIEIGGEEVYQVTNTKAQVFQNAKLFASDNYYNPASGSIKNIKWLNIGMFFNYCCCCCCCCCLCCCVFGIATVDVVVYIILVEFYIVVVFVAFYCCCCCCCITF